MNISINKFSFTPITSTVSGLTVSKGGMRYVIEGYTVNTLNDSGKIELINKWCVNNGHTLTGAQL